MLVRPCRFFASGRPTLHSVLLLMPATSVHQDFGEKSETKIDGAVTKTGVQLTAHFNAACRLIRFCRREVRLAASLCGKCCTTASCMFGSEQLCMSGAALPLHRLWSVHCCTAMPSARGSQMISSLSGVQLYHVCCVVFRPLSKQLCNALWSLAMLSCLQAVLRRSRRCRRRRRQPRSGAGRAEACQLTVHRQSLRPGRSH